MTDKQRAEIIKHQLDYLDEFDARIKEPTSNEERARIIVVRLNIAEFVDRMVPDARHCS